MGRVEARVESVEASACTIPTDAPESDGTLRWSSTTLVVVEVAAGGRAGLELKRREAERYRVG